MEYYSRDKDNTAQTFASTEKKARISFRSIAKNETLIFLLAILSIGISHYVVPILAQAISAIHFDWHITEKFSVVLDLALLGSFLKQNAGNELFTALLASSLITAYCVASTDSSATRWDNFLRKLNADVTPSSGSSTNRISLRRSKRSASFLTQLNHLPERKEILILLKQTPFKRSKSGGTPAYILNNMQDQIDSLVRSEFFRKNEGKFQWVVFVTRRGKFVAFQPFFPFYLSLNIAKNQEYETILNTADEKEFIEKIKSHTYDETYNNAGQSYSTALHGLRFAHAPEKKTRKEIMVRLVECKYNHLMLVDKKERPVGVVGAQNLIEIAVLEEILSKSQRDEINDAFPTDCDGTPKKTEPVQNEPIPEPETFEEEFESEPASSYSATPDHELGAMNTLSNDNSSPESHKALEST